MGRHRRRRGRAPDLHALPLRRGADGSADPLRRLGAHTSWCGWTARCGSRLKRVDLLNFDAPHGNNPALHVMPPRSPATGRRRARAACGAAPRRPGAGPRRGPRPPRRRAPSRGSYGRRRASGAHDLRPAHRPRGLRPGRRAPTGPGRSSRSWARRARAYGIPAGEIAYAEAARRVDALRAAYARRRLRTGPPRGAAAREPAPISCCTSWLSTAVGASSVPINPDLRSAELERLVGPCDARPGRRHAGDRQDDLRAAAAATGRRMAVVGPRGAPPEPERPAEPWARGERGGGGAALHFGHHGGAQGLRADQ